MKAKIKRRQFVGEESIESKRGITEVKDEQVKAFKETPRKIWDTFVQEFVNKSITETAPKQLIGKGLVIESRNRLYEQTELIEGEEIVLKKTKEELTGGLRIKEHDEYFRREIESSETIILRKEREGDLEKYKNIMIEIRKIAAKSKILEKSVTTLVTEVMPVNPGKYHSNFLEWVLLQLRNARTKIDEGLSWSSMFASRKHQKNLWGKAKQGGFNNVVLSGERTAATQIA